MPLFLSVYPPRPRLGLFRAERITLFKTRSHVEFRLVNSLCHWGWSWTVGLLPSPSKCWDYRPAPRHLGLCAQALHQLSYRAQQYDLLPGTLGIPRKDAIGQFLLIVMSTFWPCSEQLCPAWCRREAVLEVVLWSFSQCYCICPGITKTFLFCSSALLRW